MRFCFAAVLALACSIFPATSQADGLTFKLEGGRGILNFKDVGVFLLERDAPPPDVFFTDLESGLHRPSSAFYRGEADFDLGLASGQSLRLGVVRSRLDGSHFETTPLYFWVSTAIRYTPDGQHSVVHGQIGTCPLVDGQPQPCGTFIGGINRRYDETMPQVLLGRSSDGGGTWFGLQGFSGRLDETTSGAVEASGSAPVFMMTEMGSDVRGALLAIQHERTLSTGARLTLGLGIGRYRMEASGNSYLEGERNPNATRSITFTGTRAQLSAGMEFPLSDRLSLGGTIRADLWSDQPRINADLPDTQCIERLVCHQHVTNRFQMTTDPFSSVSVALSLTLRM